MPSKIHPAASHQVTTALQRASAATGAGLEFLKKMAARESGFDPKAKAKTSSAAGLFQFIEQTWLGAVKHYGGKHGLEAFAADITVQEPYARSSAMMATSGAAFMQITNQSDADDRLIGAASPALWEELVERLEGL